MSGLFKRKLVAEGPFDFDDEIRIERPADHVYRLLDWSDPLNALAAQGHRLRVGDRPGEWRLVMTGLEDHEYLIEIVEVKPVVRYVFDSAPFPIIGRLERARETYSFEPLGGNACLVRVKVTAHFLPRLTERQFAHEQWMMRTACHNALARLKIHAEQGAEAARDAEMNESNGYRIEV